MESLGGHVECRTDGAKLPNGNRSAYVGTARIEDIDAAKSIVLIGTNPARAQEMLDRMIAYLRATLGASHASLHPLATEFAWGKVWTRPGLTLKERSLATLSMCIALNRPAEIKIHLRGAVRNGVSREELRELILHSFLYCGGPAVLDAYKAVRDELPLIEAAEKAAQKLAPPAKKKPVKTAGKAKTKVKA